MEETNNEKIKLILMTAVITISAMLCCSLNAFALTDGDFEVQLPNNEPRKTDTHNCPTKIFADLDVTAWYHPHTDYVLENGIMNGVTKTKFAPNNNVTREQFATFMHRYAIFKGYDVESGENTNIRAYDDFERISEYAISSTQRLYAIINTLVVQK